MDSIRIDVKNARQVGLRFEQFPDQLHDALRAEIQALSQELFARIQAATPDKTGRLRSQERVRLFDDGTRITGYVDIAGEGSGKASDFAKAAALEYGARRSAKVSAHRMKLDHVWARKLAAPEMVMVKTYNRPTNIIERAFERGPLAQMQPEVAARLNAVVANATKAANA
jgi:hypothetical protein